MQLIIQQGDYIVDLSFISTIAIDFNAATKSADVKFSENPFDEEFETGESDTYTFEEEDYIALMRYLNRTSSLAA